jgi:hypothetical protein
MSLWKVIPKSLCVSLDIKQLSQYGFVLVIRDTTVEIYRYAKS